MRALVTIIIYVSIYVANLVSNSPPENIVTESPQEKMEPNNPTKKTNYYECYSRFDYEYKVLQKLVYLEESQVKSTNALSDQMNEITGLWNKLEDINDRLAEMEGVMVKSKATTAQVCGEVERLTNETRQLAAANSDIKEEIQRQREKVEANENKMKELQNRKPSSNVSGLHMGFTVRDSSTNLRNSRTTILTFRETVYKHTAGYDLATGKFVCQQPGVYLFIATIIRSTKEKTAFCHICLNGSSKVLAYASDNEIAQMYPSGTASFVTHLDVGDEVYLSECGGIGNLDPSTHFTGVLIHADVG